MKILGWLPLLIVGACASPTRYERGDVYLAHYRPLALPQGAVSLTAALDGVLAVRLGCLVIVAPSGVDVLPAFREQVRLVTLHGRIGMEDTSTGATAFVGDAVSLGGASAADAPDFAASRLVRPPPPECPRQIFASNSGFERG